MHRQYAYGLLPLVLVAGVFGCKSGAGDPPATTPMANLPAAAPPAATSPATAQSPAGTTPGNAQASASDPTQRSADLKQIMGELQALGTLDPQAQTQLIQDLQQTDPALWPLVVQAFRTSLAYRQRAKNTPSPTDKAVAGSSPTTDSGARAPASASAKMSNAAAAGPAAPIASVATTTAAAAPASAATTTATAPNATTASSPAATSPAVAASATAAAPVGTKLVGDMQQVSHETPIEDNADWSELLARTVAALEKQVQDAPQSPAAAKAQIQLRMLYLAAGRRNEALRAVPGLSGGEQDFWSDEVFGLATYLDNDRTADSGRRATEATQHLRKAVGRLSELGSLSVRNLAFCTEVNSFGTYTAFPQNEFKPNQHVLLYAEVENFKSEETPKGFHTAMRSSYHIFDSQGRKVTDQDLPITEEHCQNRRHDYFIRYFLSIPTRVYDGKYTLQLTIEDTLGHKIGQSSIDFTVKEK